MFIDPIVFRGITYSDFINRTRISGRSNYSDAGRYTNNWSQALGYATKYSVLFNTKEVIIAITDTTKVNINPIGTTGENHIRNDYQLQQPLNLDAPHVKIFIAGENLEEICEYTLQGIKFTREKFLTDLKNTRERLIKQRKYKI